MKKLLFSLVFIVSLQSFAQTSGVNFTWTGNGNPNLPNCSTTVTSSCLTGFTLEDTTTSTSPIMITSALTPSATSYTLSPLPSVGSHTYSLIVTGKDQSGNAISSSPVTTTIQIPAITLNPPTGFTGTP